TRDAGGALRGAGDVSRSPVYGSRRPDELRHQPCRCVSAGRRLYRPRAEGREAGRFAGATADQARVSHQSAGREDNWRRGAAIAAHARRRGDRVKRREFIAGLGSTAAWPLAAWARQGERMRRIGVLMGTSDENDPLGMPLVSALTQGLAGLGWTE